MQTRSYELLWAFLAIILITILYLIVAILFGSFPAAQSFFGHSLGVVGLLLMLMTETLYTLRKRSRSARWGQMSHWLQFHIFTGLVGPYLALLHTSWKFNGLAGVVVLFTLVVVISGFIGRYIYTAIPRTADGNEITDNQLGMQMQILEESLNSWLSSHPEMNKVSQGWLRDPHEVSKGSMKSVLGRFITDWSYREKLSRMKR
ncbi:MAG: hypothetical protein MUO76_05990, partial [Anaerolineaceae bacterium]|nr:hypothetical protein [Anaerolineaceae bacterium]